MWLPCESTWRECCSLTFLSDYPKWGALLFIFFVSLKMANVKGSQCISMSFESYIASWFRPYSLPLCEISFFINFLTGHKYSLYYNVFCRHGEQVIELLWTGVEGTKQKGRRGMRRAHRYDSSGNSEWRAFWWRQKLVWCSLVESYVSSCWWWKAFVHFLGLASMVTVLKIHSRKMSWNHKQVWAFFLTDGR